MASPKTIPPKILKAHTLPCSVVFAIDVKWQRYYWTGKYDREGKLERSTHRADAYKFPNAGVALTCAETHDELRNSDRWKLVPMLGAPLT